MGSYSQCIPIEKRYAVRPGVQRVRCKGGPGQGVRDRGGPRRDIGEQYKKIDILIYILIYIFWHLLAVAFYAHRSVGVDLGWLGVQRSSIEGGWLTRRVSREGFGMLPLSRSIGVGLNRLGPQHRKRRERYKGERE